MINSNKNLWSWFSAISNPESSFLFLLRSFILSIQSILLVLFLLPLPLHLLLNKPLLLLLELSPLVPGSGPLSLLFLILLKLWWGKIESPCAFVLLLKCCLFKDHVLCLLHLLFEGLLHWCKRWPLVLLFHLFLSLFEVFWLVLPISLVENIF